MRASGTATIPLLYNGQYTDTESGLIYLRARYYDPTTTQFITRDPAAAMTREPYNYADGRPLTLSDPSGLFPCLTSMGNCRGLGGSIVSSEPCKRDGIDAVFPPLWSDGDQISVIPINFDPGTSEFTFRLTVVDPRANGYLSLTVDNMQPGIFVVQKYGPNTWVETVIMVPNEINALRARLSRKGFRPVNEAWYIDPVEYVGAE
jgi:RHS repeat-associated protein